MDKLNPNRVALSLAITAALVHLGAVIIRLIVNPGDKLMAQIFEMMHPWATWLTLSGFVISLVEAILAGLIVGYVFALVYNAVAKK